jgi:hypothetical protein
MADCWHAEDPFKAREKLDEELYAPMGGWDAADQRLWAAVMSAPDVGG